MSLRNLAPAALFASAVAAAVALPGCGDGGVGKTYPVSGRVTLNGEPLAVKSATVLFQPDASQGNTTPFEPAARVDSAGNYTLTTKTQRGAPPGWYKVTVTAIDIDAEPTGGKKALRTRPLPRLLVPARYSQPANTPLRIQVVASPAEGAYDLQLKK